MPGSRFSGVSKGQQRCWSFGGCTFDEAGRTLTVDGRRVPLETKPLELLRALLERAGQVVSKDELLDAVWPEVTVVEASLPTAIYKLRLALRDDERERRLIETVSGIGYRLAVPVELDAPAGAGVPAAVAVTAAPAPSDRVRDAGAPMPDGRPRSPRLLKLASIAVLMAAASMLVAFPVFQPQNSSAAKATPAFSQRDAQNALRRLDVEAVERMLAAGWDPNRPFDDQGNGAVNYVLNICEWDPAHDRPRMLLMVRTLLEGGAKLERRNVWGDTAYSIASADRYCGRNHPVTAMLRTLCYAGHQPPGDRCLATYQLARRRDRG